MFRRNTNLIIITVLFDLLSVVAAIVCANWLRMNVPYGRLIHFEPGLKILFTEAIILYPLIFLLFSLYDPERTFKSYDEYQILGGACILGALTLAGLVYFTARDISRLLLIYFYGVHLFLVIFWRSAVFFILNKHNQQGKYLRRVLLIGGGDSARQVLTRLDNMAWARVQVIGYLTDGEPIPSTNFDIPFLGNLNTLENIVKYHKVDDLLIALPAEAYSNLQTLVSSLVDLPCNIWIVPDYFSLLIYGAHFEELGDVPMISIKVPTLSGYQRVVKRIFDLIIGTLSIIVAAPFMGLIAVAIKLDSPGPVMFNQRRVGENGRLFKMFKFRSMVDGAESRINEVMKSDENGQLVHKHPNDPRITRVGSFLRRTSLDELPQIINVLRGEMSLVGPRPELPFFVEHYDSWQHRRLAVPQGITGWWQVHGRSDKPLHLHTEDDIYYVQNYSLMLDIYILFMTIFAVLRRKGAF